MRVEVKLATEHNWQ